MAFFAIALTALVLGTTAAYFGLQAWDRFANTPAPPQVAEAASAETSELTAPANQEIAPLRDSFRELKSAALQQLERRDPSPEELLRLVGDTTGMAGIRSFSFSGTISSPNNKFDVKVFARSPDQMRTIVENDRVRITSIVNGATSKQVIEKANSTLGTERTLADYQRASMLAAFLPMLAVWQFETVPELLRGSDRENVDGESLFVVINEGNPPITMRHFINPDNFREVRREASVNENGETKTISINYPTFKAVGSAILPSSIKVKEDYPIIVTSTINIDEWSLNPGLLPSLFAIENLN